MLDSTTGAYILDSNGEERWDLDAIRPSGASNGRQILKNRDLDERNNLSAKSLVELKLAKTNLPIICLTKLKIYTSFIKMLLLVMVLQVGATKHMRDKVQLRLINFWTTV
jgi:hypothetical protein